MPRVSIVIPAYNASATIGRAIDSVFAQTFTDFEVIVVDDGSTDNPGDALRAYVERIKLVRQRNRGPAAARNLGVKCSRGEYIAFLDSDDAWMPARLEATVAALDRDPACVMVFTGAITIDREGQPTGEYSIEPDTDLEPDLSELVSGRARVKMSSCLVRREIFDRAGGFDEAAFGPNGAGEDLYFYTAVRELGKIRIIPEPLIEYRAELTRNRMWKYEPGRRILIRKWRRRYGLKIRRPLSTHVRMWVREWNAIGLNAVERKNTKVARAAFKAALRLQPSNMRTLMRYARTFLPAAAIDWSDRRRSARRASRDNGGSRVVNHKSSANSHNSSGYLHGESPMKDSYHHRRKSG